MNKCLRTHPYSKNDAIPLCNGSGCTCFLLPNEDNLCACCLSDQNKEKLIHICDDCGTGSPYHPDVKEVHCMGCSKITPVQLKEEIEYTLGGAGMNTPKESWEEEMFKNSHEKYISSESDLYINTTRAIKICKEVEHQAYERGKKDREIEIIKKIEKYFKGLISILNPQVIKELLIRDITNK